MEIEGERDQEQDQKQDLEQDQEYSSESNKNKNNSKNRSDGNGLSRLTSQLKEGVGEWKVRNPWRKMPNAKIAQPWTRLSRVRLDTVT